MASSLSDLDDFSNNKNKKKARRTIRSFVTREGRVTPFQEKALNSLLPIFSAEEKELGNLDSLFSDSNPKYLEIGFGNGANLLEQAILHPERSYLGCETYRSGVGQVLNKVNEFKIDNVRVIIADAVDVINLLSDNSLDGVFIFFPDPWPKKRHHKRRLITLSFLKDLGAKMKEHARLYMATDNESYAIEVLSQIEITGNFENIAGPYCFSPRPSWRELTRFEGRATEIGNRIFEIIACLRIVSTVHSREE